MGAAVKCPRCGSLSQVLETRSPELGQMRVDTLRLLRIKAMLAQMEAP